LKFIFFSSVSGKERIFHGVSKRLSQHIDKYDA